jgi:hypothetical protein
MTLIETGRSLRAWTNRRTISSLEGPAQLLLPDNRVAPVHASLSISETILSQSGGGSLTCDSDIAFDAINSSSWLKLTFDEGRAVEISIYQLRSDHSQARCWFEVRG